MCRQQEMYKGQSAGSAQPLVWAHSEYLKLLRSAVDGQVFDCISVVKERYGVAPGTRTFKSNLEIFQTSRPVTAMAAGMTLRVVDTVRFRVVYTMDDWATSTTMRVAAGGICGVVCGHCRRRRGRREDRVYVLLAGAGQVAGKEL